MDQLQPGDRVLILDAPFTGIEATVEQVDQEQGLAHVRMEPVTGLPVAVVVPLTRLRRLDTAP
jgi:transcription antitermination factor NusG